MYRTKRRRQEAPILTDISLTPLIDTALTLLIIFMIATPMMQNAIRITLPKGSAQEAGTTQQELVVYVNKSEDVYLNDKKVTIEELITTLKTIAGNQKDKTIFVKADTGVAYGTIIELVDKIKVIGGIKYVALATTKRA